MRLSAFLSLGISFWNLKKIVVLQNMHKMTHPFFHDASILVLVGVFLTHRVETVGVCAHFLSVKNAKTPSIWSSGLSIYIYLCAKDAKRNIVTGVISIHIIDRY